MNVWNRHVYNGKMDTRKERGGRQDLYLNQEVGKIQHEKFIQINFYEDYYDFD